MSRISTSKPPAIKKTILVLGLGVLGLMPWLRVEAALLAPTLQPLAAQCSGSSPFVTLTWSAVTGADSYEIYKDGASVGIVPLTTYDDLAVSPKENRSYFVKARNAGGEVSPTSNTETIVVPRCGPVLTLSSSSCLADGPKIDLSWNGLANVTGYEVYRDSSLLVRVPAVQTSHSDVTAAGSGNYNYVVRAVWSGESKDSNSLLVNAPSCPPVLSANGNCNAPGAEASLSWAALRGATEYRIFKNGAFLTSVSNVGSFDDKSVAQLSSPSYFVKAVYGAAGVADSNSAAISVPRCPPVLASQSTCNSTNPLLPEIKLTWTTTAGATLYDVFEAVKGFLAQLASPAASYTDGLAQADNGKTFTYRVEAKGAFPTLASNQVSATANCSLDALPSPAPVLTATPVCSAGDSQMALSWTPSNNVLYYTIERTNNSTALQSSWNVLSSDTSATDPNVEVNVSYTYKVIAVGNGGSTPSNVATKTSVDCTLPSTPTLASPTALCSSGKPVVALSWVKSTNTTKYEIYRDGAKINEITDPNTTAYSDTTVANSASYSYEIRAVGPGGITSSGAPKSVTTGNCTPPSSPVLAAGAPTCSVNKVAIALSWTPSANVSYYDVYRRKTGEVAFSRMATSLTATNYTDSGLAEGLAEVSYFVMAVGPAGTGSTPSNQETRSTPYCPPPKPILTVSETCSVDQPVMNLSWTTVSGLAAAYSFDEGSGLTTSDLSSNGNTGSLVNGATWAAAGKYGQAISYDGLNDYVNVGNRSVLNLANNFTIEAWIYPKGGGSSVGIIVNKESTYQIGRFSDGTIRWAFRNSSPGFIWVNTGAAVPLNQWTHIAVTYSPGAQIKTYKNGGLVHTYNGAGSVSINTNALWIGGRSGASQYFKGVIDDLRIYRRELSAAEISSDMNTPVAAPTTGTISTYEIRRDGALLGTRTPPTTTYTDSTVVSGQSYAYNVTAVGPAGSTKSLDVTKTALVCTAPSKPVITSTTPKCSASVPQMTITWDTTTNTVSYDIFRNGAKITATPIAFASGATSYTFTDTGPLIANTTYAYTVVANGPAGAGLTSSDPAAATTSYCLPSTPNLTVTPQCAAGKAVFKLDWTDATPSNTTQYEIRRDSNPTPIKVDTIPANTKTFTDDNGGAGFSTGEIHSYTVTTVGPAGSALSPSKSGTALNCLTSGQPTISSLALACVGGKALNFDGIDDYVNLGNPADLRITRDMTIEMWLRPTDFAARRNPYAKAYGGEGTMTVETNGSITYYFGTCGGNCSPFTLINTNSSLTANVWTHIVVVRDLTNGRLRWYKNGVLTNETMTAYTTARNSSLNAFIGRGYVNNFKGQIDEVRVYDRALSAAEIATHYNGAKGEYGSAESGLKGGWHFEEGVGTLVADYSGRRNDGTLVNGPSWVDDQVAVGSVGTSPFQQVRIDWTAAANTTQYEIFRGITKIATVPAASPQPASYSHYDTYNFPTNILTAGQTYGYKVDAVNVAAGTRNSSVPLTTAVLPTCSPTTPFWSATYPQAICSATKSAADLRWTYAQPLAASKTFDIKRDDTKVRGISSSGSGSERVFEDDGGAGLSPGRSYDYQIEAVGPTGLKTSYATKSILTFACSIAAPALNSSCSSPFFNPVVHLAWQRTNDNLFSIYRKRSSDASPSALPFLVNNDTSASPTILREWLLLGPFPNSADTGLATDYIDADPAITVTEATILPRSGETVNSKVWKRIGVSSASDFVNLESAAAFGSQDNVVAYALAYVINTTAGAVSGDLRLGSDDGIKAYVNGVKVHENHVHRSAARDQDRVDVTLNAGLNTILLKIEETSGGWGFYARLTDKPGNPLLATVTSSDYAAPVNEAADYYIYGSPTGRTSGTASVPAFSCVPGKPTLALVPACAAQQTTITLSWPGTANTAFYRAYRSAAADLSGAAEITPPGNPIAYDPAVSPYAFTDTGIEENRTYYYYVTAFGNGSTRSDAVSDRSLVCTTKPDKPVLAAANVTPTCSGTSSRVLLDWPDAANAISYTVHRDGVPLTPSVTSSAFTDGSVVGGRAYVYKIEAKGTGGSTFSDPVTVAAIDCSGPPQPPILNSANVIPRATNVFLSWTDRSLNEEGFRVQRTTLVGALRLRSLLASLLKPVEMLAAVVSSNLPPDTTSYTDAAQENTTYEYSIEAFNSAPGSPVSSNAVQVFVPVPAPGSFAVNASCSQSGVGVTLNWSPGAATTPLGGQVTYNAYWSQSETGSFSLLPQPCSRDITSTSCTTPVPLRGVKLWYKVTARNNGGTTDAVTSQSCTLPPPKFREILPPF